MLDEEQNSSDEGEDSLNLFRSALDVGSNFLEVTPDNELVFTNN